MPYDFFSKNTAEVLTSLFGENFLLILFLILILFLMENQSLFQKEISTLNSKISSFRSMLDAVCNCGSPADSGGCSQHYFRTC